MLRSVAVLGGASLAYVLIVRGALTLDIGIGRTVRPLGPLRRQVSATPKTVYDVIAQPYLGRTPRALAAKLAVLERGTDMVLAAHFTPIARGLVATTVETVRFEPPHRVSFRLVRGPVPYIVETFDLHEIADGTEIEYTGELGTDFWAAGRVWGDRVAHRWERAVGGSLDSIKAEAERRSRARATAAS
jgi:Polyketide cyclase / dehydrase and lipid transport